MHFARPLFQMNVRLSKSTGLVSGIAALCGLVQADPLIFSEAGPALADIQDTIDAFRVSASDSGGVAVDNGVGGGPYDNGIRHIDWNLVGPSAATPNTMPGDYFATTVPVGANIATTGVGLRVSALPGEGPELRFGDINPQYSTIFQAAGDNRVFAPELSTVTDVRFTLPSAPGSPAWVNGFGAVFFDVDGAAGTEPTSIEFWDINGRSLGHTRVPVSDSGVSFLGVRFDPGVHVGLVRITSGNIPLLPGIDDGLGGVVDIVAMGSFFFSEPMAIPEPTPLALGLLGLFGLAVCRRRS